MRPNFFATWKISPAVGQQPEGVQGNLRPAGDRDKLVNKDNDPKGTLLYRSPKVRTAASCDGIKKFHNHVIRGHTCGWLSSNEGGLTLRVGDDLKAISQIGRQ